MKEPPYYKIPWGVFSWDFTTVIGSELCSTGVRGQMKKNKKAYGFYWIRAKDYENYLRVNLKE